LGYRDYLKRLLEYKGFTDIEYFPKKSLNCQARSCAIFVALMQKGLLENAVADKEKFISVLLPDSFAQ
jgi:hypothetical protein